MEDDGDELACIVYDNGMFFVDDVVTQLRIPSIVLRAFSATYLHSMLTILQKPDKYFPFEGMRPDTTSASRFKWQVISNSIQQAKYVSVPKISWGQLYESSLTFIPHLNLFHANIIQNKNY